MRKLFIGINVFIIVMLLTSVYSSAFSREQHKVAKNNAARNIVNQSILTSDLSNQIKQEYGALEKKQTRLSAALQKSIRNEEKAQKLQNAALDYLSNTDRIRSFVLGIRKMKAEGVATEKIHEMLNQRLSLRKAAQTGSISGTVTVKGTVPPGDVIILAFDTHGYLAGESSASLNNGMFTISDLPAGDYYVVTESGFVNEFYNNVPSGNFSNWRSATPVSVADNTDTPNINFDLETGATISGILTDEESGTPLAFYVGFFTVFDVSGNEIRSETVFTGLSGEYTLTVGDVGSYIVYVSVPGYVAEYYDNQTQFKDATAIVITDPTQEISGIDFTLLFDTGVPTSNGSFISGAVTSETDGSLLNFVLIFAFNASDTSIAGFGLSGLMLGKATSVQANYAITGLEAGSYFLMATDLLQGYSREFYQESQTPDGATPVAVAENDSATGINFTLDMGGSISGTVTNEAGTPLKDVFVVALKGDLNFDKFFSNLDVGFDTTNAQGNYKITGISSGDYAVRTVIISNDNFGGMYLDEWYSNIYSIFKYNEAQKVTVEVPNETAGINFQLEKAGVVSGKITEVDGSTPVLDVAAVIAINSETSLPELAPFDYTNEADGGYTVGLLEPGAYKLYALVDFESSGMYISEFYDGAMSFDEANEVNVSFGDTTKNVDFTLEKGGTVQGYVMFNQQISTGADTLYDFPVVIFNATSGEVAGATSVTFTGGFRIPGLPAGQYKMVALPVMTPYTATYFGGGNTFDDPESQVINVVAGTVLDLNILLEQATGTIRGTITEATTGTQLNMVLVFTYDGTGHIVSAGMSGYDLLADVPTGNDGVYEIADLRSGSYSVRTFALFSLIESFTGLGTGSLDDPFAIFGSLGDLFGGGLYKDEWYDDVAVELPKLNFDTVFGLVNSLRYGEFGFLPFYEMPPVGATAVSVTNGSVTGGIDFALGKFSLNDIQVAVDDKNDKPLPQSYNLGQSYPNPIHRNQLNNGVTIQFELPEMASIAISIYNILGQKVADLTNQRFAAGSHTIQWNGRDDRGALLSSGVYFYSLKTKSGLTQMKKLVILR